MAAISFSIPTDSARAFVEMWKELRLAEALGAENDLHDPTEIENFDGATLVKWVVDLTPAILPIVSAALTYVVTSRGEVEYEKDGEKMRFKNLKPSRIKEVLDLIDERGKE